VTEGNKLQIMTEYDDRKSSFEYFPNNTTANQYSLGLHCRQYYNCLI